MSAVNAQSLHLTSQLRGANMNIIRIARMVLFSFSICSLSITAATQSSSTPQSQAGPAAPSSNKMLDSIPPTLFQKMFQSHKLVGSPGLGWKKQRVITVAFYGGSDELYQLIEQTANEWIALGGQMSFSFKDDAGRYRHWTPDDKSPAANIRIAFNNTGSGEPLPGIAGNPVWVAAYWDARRSSHSLPGRQSAAGYFESRHLFLYGSSIQSDCGLYSGHQGQSCQPGLLRSGHP